MKKLFALLVTFSMLFMVVSLTYGCEIAVVDSLPYDGFGARADAMGGAFTAVADDGFAPYWNPAGIAQLKAIAITADLGLIPGAFSHTNSTSIKFGGGITTQSLAGNIFAKVYEGPDLDGVPTHQVRADSILTAATPLFVNWIMIGGNVKYITSSYYRFGEYISQGGQGGAMAYDLGLLIRPNDYLSIGFVGRDINAPSVEITGDDFEFTVNFYDSYTFGLALKPSKSTTLAADLDITSNRRILRLGLEQTALWEFIAVRAGMVKLLNARDVPAKINVGAGLKLFGIYVNGALLGVNHRENLSIEVSAGFMH